MVFVILVYLLTALVLAADEPTYATHGLLPPSSKLRLTEEDDPRFSMNVDMSATSLPPTAVLMNAVELAAQYAGMEYLARVPQRHGIVLAQFPQVEIAIVPARPARTVEVRLIMYTIYGAILEMKFGRGFHECEIEVLWENQIKAYVYFTPPTNDKSSPTGRFKENVSRLSRNLSAPESKPTNLTSSSVNTVFDWTPVYEPRGQNIPPFEVFLLALGAIKVVAVLSTTTRVGEPLHIGSELLNANFQVWPEMRRSVGQMRYGHVLEAARRIPGWQLARHRFAEFFAGIEANRRPLGVVLIQKGQYVPVWGSKGGNVSVS
ncbi:MAG: hypothetical protein LQ339_008729 [Xanthoria mediterranea]|nr:MAG: hypothetical protein LQ339_008729 [Xanthoria mediterranea]